MNKYHDTVWYGMIAVAVILSLAAITAIIIGYRDAKHRDVPFQAFSPTLPGLDHVALLCLLFFAHGFIPDSPREYILPGVFLAGFISAACATA